MRYRSIDVDEEVYHHLLRHARSFDEDANTVLRRLLLEDDAEHPQLDLPEIDRVPTALRHTLLMIYLVRVEGFSRTDATRRIAAHDGVERATVHDKFTRQLGLDANEVDLYLNQESLRDFQSVLGEHFPKHLDYLQICFDRIRHGDTPPSKSETYADFES